VHVHDHLTCLGGKEARNTGERTATSGGDNRTVDCFELIVMILDAPRSNLALNHDLASRFIAAGGLRNGLSLRKGMP
jgi:hypothetical protein